jgi:hypothetical protein
MIKSRRAEICKLSLCESLEKISTVQKEHELSKVGSSWNKEDTSDFFDKRKKIAREINKTDTRKVSCLSIDQTPKQKTRRQL